MLGSDVLNVAKFPTATFDIQSAAATGNKSPRGLPTYRLTGEFMLHGTIRPQVIVAEVEQARGWLHVRGNFSVRQSSYGTKPFSKAIGVADALRIHGDLWIAPHTLVSMSEIPKRL